jgi:hypothetical protein
MCIVFISEQTATFALLICFFFNRDEKCLLRGTNWVFKWNSLRFVFKGLTVLFAQLSEVLTSSCATHLLKKSPCFYGTKNLITVIKKGFSLRCILQSGPFHNTHPFLICWRVRSCKVCPKEVLGFSDYLGIVWNVSVRYCVLAVDQNFCSLCFPKRGQND